MADKKLGWKELPAGDLLEGGTAANFKTGDWRSEKPVWNKQKCIQCKICWISCPDTAIIIKDGKRDEFDLDFCKGCGICAKECPPKVQAITMVKEEK